MEKNIQEKRKQRPTANNDNLLKKHRSTWDADIRRGREESVSKGGSVFPEGGITPRPLPPTAAQATVSKPDKASREPGVGGKAASQPASQRSAQVPRVSVQLR